MKGGLSIENNFQPFSFNGGGGWAIGRDVAG